MSEKEGYRENLCRIRECFPGREALRKGEVAEFLGLDRRTITRKIRFSAATKLVTVQDFARQISV